MRAWGSRVQNTVGQRRTTHSRLPPPHYGGKYVGARRLLKHPDVLEYQNLRLRLNRMFVHALQHGGRSNAGFLMKVRFHFCSQHLASIAGG